jgi:hypothetical protein
MGFAGEFYFKIDLFNSAGTSFWFGAGRRGSARARPPLSIRVTSQHYGCVPSHSRQRQNAVVSSQLNHSESGS